LLLVNLAAAGPVVCAVLEWRAVRCGDDALWRIGGALARCCLVSLLLGALLGFTSAGLMWIDGRKSLFDAAARFPAARYWYAAAELAFYLACMALYAAWRRRGPHGATWQRAARRGLAVLASANLLYHFPPLLVLIDTLAYQRPDWPDTITPVVFRRLLLEGGVAARSLHHVVAALAVAGVATMMLATRRGLCISPPKITLPETSTPETTMSESNAPAGIVWGARIALAATLVQIPVGLWLLLETPERDRLLGGDALGTGLLLAAITATFVLLHHLTAAATGDAGRRHVVWSAGLLVAVVILMDGTLARTRGGARPTAADSTYRSGHTP
jgi:hypothetical protein